VKNDRRVLVLWTRKELTMVKAQAYLKAGQHSLLATRAELDMTPLLHEIFLCQEQLDVVARRKQPLVIKKRGSYASISYDGGVLFQVVWVRGMGRSCVH
jgi:hypothetical protein